MIPNSRSLLIRIHDLLDGKMDAQHAEQVAADYNQFCEQINVRIRQFSKLIREGNYYAALDIAQLEPGLITQIERIRFPRESEWRQFLSERALHGFEGFDDAELKRAKEICADRSICQPGAYRAYRKAILLKNKPDAIHHLRKLCNDFPKDANARHELIRLEKEAFETIDKELTTLLRMGKTDAAILKVDITLQQEWVISFESENWQKAYKLYEAHEHQKYFDEIVQSISQAKVIQRVGDWRDAAKVISKLTKAKDAKVYAELTALQQNELNSLLKWYHQCELETNADLRNREAFEQFKQHLRPDLIEKNLHDSRRPEIRQFQKTLELEWSRFQGITPALCAEHEIEYQKARNTIESLLHRRRSSGTGWKWFWVVTLPVILLAAGALFWINHKEARLAGDVSAAHEAEDVSSTRVALKEWEEFTSTFFSQRNPFRHYRAHRQVQEIRGWIDEIDLRHDKMAELLDRIELSLHDSTSRSELRRIQLNLSIVKDLLDKVPEGSDDSLSIRFRALNQQIMELQAEQVENLRSELTNELEILESSIRQTFPPAKTRFDNVQKEIAEIRSHINELQAKFRQSFQEQDVVDLRERLDADAKQLEDYESAVANLSQFTDRLRQSIALSEYLEYLHQLSILPFQKHPIVSQAIRLIQKRSQFENMAQQLLLPDNPLAWEQFLKKTDAAMMATEADPKESAAWKNLSAHAPLRDIYRYRLLKFKDGAQVGTFRMLYSQGEMELSSDTSQTSGRKVHTIKEFDERYIGRGLPFTEKLYICETDANGNPLNGELLELDRLSPESGFFRQISELCAYHAETQTLGEPLLEVIDTVKTNEFISPIFKAWVIQEMFNIMIVRPYDWGLNFCPSAQLEYKNLSTIKGTLYPYDWMRPSTQNRLLQPLIGFFENLRELSYYKQAQASLELFKQIARQRVRYGGYVNDNGLFMLLNGTPNDRKLFGMLKDGNMGLLRRPGSDKVAPTNYPAEPFSPIMFFNDPPEVILDRVTRNTGVDVNSEAFRPYLPPIFL